jgi:hypothetical protein
VPGTGFRLCDFGRADIIRLLCHTDILLICTMRRA